MNIIKEKWKFLNSLTPLAPKQIEKLFNFGLQTLAFRNIQSLRSNARIINLNWFTAKTKIYRLTSNSRIPKIFVCILKQLNIVGEKDIIAVDFSDFGNNFQVLMFAKQTRKGRAIPIYFEILKYPIKKDSQNIFIIQAIKNLNNILEFKPKLVFDRGFACPLIIKYLCKNKHIFYIRIKKKKYLIDRKTNRKILALNLKENDVKVIAYDNNLRLIISDKIKGLKEPWYLITNDFRTKRENIIKIYYYRFEIEEFFRDAKRLLGLEYVNFKKTLSLTISLWFVILSCWFTEQIDEKIFKLNKKEKDNMRLSNFRYIFELYLKEIIQVAEGKYMKLLGG